MRVMEHSEPTVVSDLAGFVKVYSDGSISRESSEPTLHNTPIESTRLGVVTTDVVIDDEIDLWVRIYTPEENSSNVVLVYLHAGGFCMLSPKSVIPHNLCVVWSASLNVTIVSVNYRLAPEHRLPAAYVDGLRAVRWVLRGGEGQAEGLIRENRSVYLVGETAGCNIAHHVMIQANEDERAGVKGIVMLQPFFGSEKRTPSESVSAVSSRRRLYDVKMSDTLWRMALPLGANKDHPFCNPEFISTDSCGKWNLPPALVVIGGREVGSERQRQYCRMLRELGVKVESVVFEEEAHAFCSLRLDGHNSSLVIDRVRRFIGNLRLSRL